MEDRTGQWVDLETTPLASIGFAALHAVKGGIYNSTLGTGCHITVALQEDIVQTSIVVRKLILKLLYGVVLHESKDTGDIFFVESDFKKVGHKSG